ncbi:unnamed protein product, partial [Cylicostephanus goldi]
MSCSPSWCIKEALQAELGLGTWIKGSGTASMTHASNPLALKKFRKVLVVLMAGGLQISKLNASFIRTANLPVHITQLKSQWKEQEAERERQRIYLLNLVNIKVHLNMVCDNDSMLSEQFVIDMPRSNTLCDVYNQALKFFEEKAQALATSEK